MAPDTAATADNRPRPSTRCYLTPDCRWYTLKQGAAGMAAWQRHEATDHAETLPQLPSVAWHSQAMAGILTLCRSGRPFVVSEVIALGVPDAPNPRTDWPRVTNEARDNGWMTPTGKLGHSVRPTTKGSPATEWIGTAKATGVAA